MNLFLYVGIYCFVVKVSNRDVFSNTIETFLHSVSLENWLMWWRNVQRWM